MPKQPWIGKPAVDIFFILLPPFASLLIVILIPQVFQDNKELTLTGWIVLILLIDVAHVYSTLYRTYFDPMALIKQRSLLWSIPFFAFVAGVLVYSMSSLIFWRLLAYVAVYHFVRQQYGFMRVYSRKEPKKTIVSVIDSITIYSATLYPVLYWHLEGPRNFNWFIEDDFLFIQWTWLLPFLSIIYFLVVAAFLFKEGWYLLRKRTFNLPKFAVISGTLLSWYFGIVYFNGDMAFTLLNVVSHGIPYMALIWIYGEKNYAKKQTGYKFLKMVFSRYGVVIFLGLVFLFAFIEEGLWDLTVWKEHKNIFGSNGLFDLELNDRLLSFVVPLLALPQITHYILDGFIWKVKKDEFRWSNEVEKRS